MKTKISKMGGKGILTILLLLNLFTSTAQYCDSITPTMNVDLSASPYMNWVSPLVYRDGYCCGASAPDVCLEFVITLHPGAASVVFNIASGAVPPGALFYQIDCGPATPVGAPICLTGTGPFHLTFCKPGNNANTFSIETIPNPIFGPDVIVGAGCSEDLWVQFYDESSITWNSIQPGAPGAYNASLSCTSGCDTVSTNYNTPVALQVDYLVCGLAQNGCTTDPICDTLSAMFAPELTATIQIADSVLCYNETLTPASVLVSGGTPPYQISWSNGTTGSNTSLAPGTHTVQVTDASNCIVVSDQVTVIQIPQALVDAGTLPTSCQNDTGPIAMNASATNVVGYNWSGGAGVFTPSSAFLNPNYTPTAAELLAGSVTLTLTGLASNGCPNAVDQVTLTFAPVANTVVVQTTPVSCFGGSNGSMNVVSSGTYAPFTYAVNGGAFSTSSQFTGLAAGLHTVTIQNSLGCDTTIQFVISQPSPLVLTELSHTNVTCFGGATGSAQVSASGGTPNYQFSWSNGVSGSQAIGLTAGSYTATVTDFNGCQTNLVISIAEPAPLTIALNAVPPNCFGASNGAVTAVVNGGFSPYTYNWSNGAASTSIYSIPAGAYQVQVLDSAGCQSQAVINVIDPPQLTLVLTPDTTVCQGTPVNVTAVATGGTGTYTYFWTPAAGNTASITVTPSMDQTVYCVVQDNNGCTVSDTGFIDTYELLTTDLMASISDDSICAGEAVTLNAAYTGTVPGVSLSWQHCPTCMTQHEVVPDQTTVYTVSATDFCGSVIETAVAVVVIPLPVLSLDPILATACPNEYFSVSANGAGSSEWDYFWDFGDGTISHDQVGIHHYPSQGAYTVQLYVVNEFGCGAADTISGQVVINPQAEATFSASDESVTTLNPEVSFTNLSVNANEYQWNFGDGGQSTETDPVHEFLGYGFYTVTLNANNPYNCPGQYQLVIEVKPEFTVYVPNTFTPDGDKHNEVFYVEGTGIQKDHFEFEIYNRWGEMIFRSDNMDIGWDGSYKGIEQAQDGVYTWKVKFWDLQDGRHEMTGHVSLLK